MPEISLSLPTSPTPVTSGSPAGEVRAASDEPVAEDAGTFAHLLKGNLETGQRQDVPPDVLADLMADGNAPDEDLQDLIASTELPAGAEALAAALLLAPAAQGADALKSSGHGSPGGETALLDAGSADRRSGKSDAASLLAAGIAARTGSNGDARGNTLPDFEGASEQLPDAFADGTAGTMQAAQQTDFRAHMTAAQTQQARTELAVSTPLGQPGWADDVGHQMTWLSDQGIGKAELVLTPPHLGRIEISLEIGSDLSNAQFVSASPQVREALEQAMPRLREMLAQSGISLGEANVSSDQPSREGQSGERQGHRTRDSGELAAPLAGRRQIGLVDLFA